MIVLLPLFAGVVLLFLVALVVYALTHRRR